MVEEPPAHLDCVAQERVGVVVGVLLVGEGEVVELALAQEGGVLAKAGLVRLGDQPGASRSRLRIGAAIANMAATGQQSVLTRDGLVLSTLVQTWLHPSLEWERVTLGPTIWIEEVPDSIQDSFPSHEYLHCHCLP